MAEGVLPLKFIDVTRPLSERVPVYPGDAPPAFTVHDHGAYRTTSLRMGSHQGTHIDAPSHYLAGGESVDKIPLNNLIGPCLVIDVRPSENMITPDTILPYLGLHTRILLRTSASGADSFGTEYPCLHPLTARALVDRGVFLVGIDSPSVENYTGDGSVHRILLGHPAVIIELLDLSRVEEGVYDLIALPLRIQGAEGSPARVILCNRGEI
jgi:arylformamidase